uniref:Uncharacterized protein n=1 Tax=Mimiviridae sp. ChoanoV1 TaxID=2596887 RepID=A0A5B8IIY9_9VIRU|nr:hypothetical protein 5_79 [Mimiviridae sp. ChoanoV1]
MNDISLKKKYYVQQLNTIMNDISLKKKLGSHIKDSKKHITLSDKNFNIKIKKKITIERNYYLLSTESIDEIFYNDSNFVTFKPSIEVKNIIEGFIDIIDNNKQNDFTINLKKKKLKTKKVKK